MTISKALQIFISKGGKIKKLKPQKSYKVFDETKARVGSEMDIRTKLGGDDFPNWSPKAIQELRGESVAIKLANRKFFRTLPKEIKTGRKTIAKKIKSFGSNQRGKYRAVRSPDASQFLGLKDFPGTKKGSVTKFYTPGGTPHPIRLNIFNIKNPKGIVTQRNVVAAPITKWKKPPLAHEQTFAGFTGKYKIQSVNPKIRSSILLKQAKSKSALKRSKKSEAAADIMYTKVMKRFSGKEKASPFKTFTKKTPSKFVTRETKEMWGQKNEMFLHGSTKARTRQQLINKETYLRKLRYEQMIKKRKK